VRQAVHHDLDWYRDLLFDLFRGPAGPLCNDLNIIVGDVRLRFDWQILEGDNAPGEEQNRQRKHQKPVIKREIDNTADHGEGLLST